uniref:Uncharacterized protein n=2 Tax=Hymenolepis diminuta TaxID=6216 RepID=A0A0R3SM63_HYMDI
LPELTCLAGDRHAIHANTLGEEGEGAGEGEEEGINKKKEGEEGDEGEKEEDKEKNADGEATTDGEAAGESGDAKKKERVDGGLSEMPSKKKNSRSGRGDGKREGGILKLGAGKKHQKQTLTQIIPDRAHAIALAEAVVKNANAAAAAAVAAANKLEVPGGATVGLHQSHLAAHSDPSGTPKIYASRSSRQAKQRQEEIENARRQSEEAARAAAEAKAMNGAQRQEKRRQRRLHLAQQAAVAATRQSGPSAISRSQSGVVKFGAESERGPMLLGQGSRASLKPPPDDEESQSAPGSNLRRNTSSSAVNGVPKFKKPIPLIIHPPEA